MVLMGRARVWTAMAGLVMAGPALVACAVDEQAACFEAEQRDFPVVEEVARTAMADAPVTAMTRLSACEDTGSPGAIVVADVESWKSRDDAIRYLLGKGFTFIGGIGGRSPDGRYAAYVMRSNLGGTLHVEVRFMEAFS
jgi:hypothetical protein